jgi:hypothetical protein
MEESLVLKLRGPANPGASLEPPLEPGTARRSDRPASNSTGLATAPRWATGRSMFSFVPIFPGWGHASKQESCTLEPPSNLNPNPQLPPTTVLHCLDLYLYLPPRAPATCPPSSVVVLSHLQIKLPTQTTEFHYATLYFSTSSSSFLTCSFSSTFFWPDHRVVCHPPDKD